MAFPSSPTDGQIYTTGNVTYTYNASKGVWDVDTISQLDVDSAVADALSSKTYWENQTTISQNYTVTANRNSLSAGPITITSGVTVTVPDGCTWTVV